MTKSKHEEHQQLAQELSQILVGHYNIQNGISLAVDSGYARIHTEAAHFHEWVHSELTDNSAYGYFQQLLLSVRQMIEVQPWNRLVAEAFDRSMKHI